MKQTLETRREEEHLQECRKQIAQNVHMYEEQVEQRHQQTQALIKAVQSLSLIHI